MLNEEPPNSDIARSKSAIVLQLYSIILLVNYKVLKEEKN